VQITCGSEKFSLKDGHPYAKAIVALARAYPGDVADRDTVPTRNDVKQLWRELSDGHKALLKEVSRCPSGIQQAELEKRLNLDWQGLRGVHNGLARICDRLGVEKPVRVLGYNAKNRRYLVDPDVSGTIKKL